MNPTFSVIIPTYNRAKELRKCLESLASQTFKNFDVYVCDDGSSDETPQVVTSFINDLHITYLPGVNSGGPAHPRNRGVVASKAHWICFLDSDDWWYPNKLEEVSKHLLLGDIIYHLVDEFGPQGTRIRATREIQFPYYFDLLSRRNPICNSSLCIRRSCLDAIGNIDESNDKTAVEDYDMLLRLAQRGCSFHSIDDVLGAYYYDNTNSTNNISASQNQCYKEYTLICEHVHNLPKGSPYYFTVCLEWFYVLGRQFHRRGDFKTAQLCYSKAATNKSAWILSRLAFLVPLAIMRIRL